METFTKFRTHQQPLQLSLHRHFPSFCQSISSSSSSSSLSFKTLSPSSSEKKFPSIKCSSSSSNPHNPKPQTPNTFIPNLIKTTCLTITAAALVFSRLNQKNIHAIAAPAPPSTVEPAAKEDSSDDGVNLLEKEKTLEEYLSSHPENVETLRGLMECKIKLRKLQDALSILDRLIEIEPNDPEWPLLKSNIYSYSGESDQARLGFEEILQKDPLKVEAYHGLVMAVSQSENGQEMNEVVKRIEAAMERCKKEKKVEDLRDFKLLVAQIRVIEGNYSEALKVYQELVKEEPRDFRPYLCQGIIYTLMKKKDEAEKQFQKYRRLVPKDHPYAQFFDDNVLATKVFSQKAENERVVSKS